MNLKFCNPILFIIINKFSIVEVPLVPDLEMWGLQFNGFEDLTLYFPLPTAAASGNLHLKGLKDTDV